MITQLELEVNTLDEKSYNKLAANLDLSKVECSCGHSGCMIRHGYYSRKIKTRNGTITLRILRVKCKECGKTHAVFPANIVPYSQIPVDIQQSMIIYPMGSEEIQTIMNGNSDITESDILHTKYNYSHFWKERLYSIGVSVFDDIIHIIQESIQAFRRQFMQNRRGLILPFLKTT